MNALLTGSHAYGNPHAKSDVDLVIRCDEHTKQFLTDRSDNGKAPILFGKLNIIACTTDEQYAVWVLGTRSMFLDKVNKKITYSSEEGKAVLDVLREMIGVKDQSESGGK